MLELLETLSHTSIQTDISTFSLRCTTVHRFTNDATEAVCGDATAGTKKSGKPQEQLNVF